MQQKKFLIIGPSWVGDLILTSSLITLLKQLYPNCYVAITCPKWNYELAKRISDLDEAILLDLAHGEFNLTKRYQYAKTLTAQQFTNAIVIPGSFKAALIPFLARIPIRTGWLKEFRFWLLNDIRRLNKQQHVRIVDRYCALAYLKQQKVTTVLTPQPKLTIDESNVKLLCQTLNLTFNTKKKIAAFCMGAAYGASKRWPVQHFVTLAKLLTAEYDIWLFGAPNELELETEFKRLNQVNNNINVTSFIGKLSLPDTVDLMSMVDIVVANDSGLMHLAASLDKKVIALYGSTAPTLAPPLSQNAIVLYENLSCSPCNSRTCKYGHYNCLYNITPLKVANLM